MGDVHIPEPPRGAVGAKVQELIDSGHEFYATAVTGVPHGRTRRPTLFVIAMVSMMISTQFWAAAVIGLIALTVLAVSDSTLVELT